MIMELKNTKIRW
ncbi:BnaA03g47780D [Brassica napus]|uniref:BnaA03g47780D protein n=1 Tax=Brassica napus TaxID=3708 RepID=A0A078CEW2_BRANA|nr:BnaA03g47780D [Brassica napus]